MILPGRRCRSTARGPATDSVARRCSGTLFGGGVSERPKEHASKACEGATPPWVQVPPPPLRPAKRGHTPGYGRASPVPVSFRRGAEVHGPAEGQVGVEVHVAP